MHIFITITACIRRCQQKYAVTMVTTGLKGPCFQQAPVGTYQTSSGTQRSARGGWETFSSAVTLAEDLP